MKIVIVGGGTAGWLTALYAKKLFKNDHITLIESQDIPIKIIHSATGGINENDILLAKASEGIVFGFNSDAILIL